MRRLKCLLRRHDWLSEYNHEDQRTIWECRRCGASKLTGDHIHPDIAAGGAVCVFVSGPGVPGDASSTVSLPTPSVACGPGPGEPMGVLAVRYARLVHHWHCSAKASR
jgi:hypothetical protein